MRASHAPRTRCYRCKATIEKLEPRGFLDGGSVVCADCFWAEVRNDEGVA